MKVFVGIRTGDYAASFDARACSCYVCFVQQGTSSVSRSAIERVVELVPGVVMKYMPMEGSWTYIALACAIPWRRPRGYWGRAPSWSRNPSRAIVTVGSEYINETWTNLMLYAVLMDWYMRILFARWGGLRATLRAARELKAVRDECRAREASLLNERGASRA